jgi:8-amino-7-oxononanoate synthase
MSASGWSLLEARVRDQLWQLESDGLLRSLASPSGLDLASNDYLNLSTHPRLIDRFAAAVRSDGCGSTGSRLLRGERERFARVEQRFAQFKGTEQSLYFSSGYLANLGVLGALAADGDVILSDERNHASLIDGMRLSRATRVVFPHNDAAAVRRLLAEATHAPDEGGARASAAPVRFVVVESLFSMDGDIAPLTDYASICREHGAVLIVDEAHAVGIYGERGSGLIEAAGLDPNGCLSINTAGKALGVAGAFVAGPEWAIEFLVQRARSFVFSTAPPPAVAAALDESLAVIGDEPERRVQLLSRSRYLRARLADAGIDVPAGESQIIPIVLGANERATTVAGALRREGFDVRAIRPPSVPSGTARLRVSVNAALPEDVLARFATSLAVALKEIGLCSAVSS